MTTLLIIVFTNTFLLSLLPTQLDLSILVEAVTRRGYFCHTRAEILVYLSAKTYLLIDVYINKTSGY